MAKSEQGSNWTHTDGVVLGCGSYTWTEEAAAVTRTIGGKSVSCKIVSVGPTKCGYAITSKGEVYFLY